jgi:hypothetical protein
MPTQAHTLSPTRQETTAQPATWKRVAARWMATFSGFPIGGYAAYLISGPVDGLTAALIGGALTGAILGAAQVWALRLRGAAARHWVAATAAGLMVGLAVGAAVVGYHTDIIDLVVQGAITGLAVGAAQGVLLRAHLGRSAWAWPPLLSGLFATGWVVTIGWGIDVDEQFTIFGASGALVVTAATIVLPVLLYGRSQNRTGSQADGG